MSSISSTRTSSRSEAALRAAAWAVLAVSAAGGLLHLAGVELAARLPGAPLCAFHAVTGLPCPGCGMTRAFLALGRLDLRAAWAFNPLVFPLAALTALYAAGRVPRALRSDRVVYPALAGVLVFWTARLLPYLR